MTVSKISFILILLLQATVEVFSLHGSLLTAQWSVTATTADTNHPRPALTAPGAAGVQGNRLRRKADFDATSSPVEYMIQLRDSLTDADGKPRTESEDPTNVWCLLDRDLIDGMERSKPSNKRCKITHNFPFNTDALINMFEEGKVALQTGHLRTHMNVIGRYAKLKVSISVHFTSVFLVTDRDTNHTMRVEAGEEDMVITANSSGWIQLNLTSGLRKIQSLSSKIQSSVELSVGISVDCKSNKKVPVVLTDPATVPLAQTPRRLRLSKLQPMLLVFLSDENIKTEIKQESEAPVTEDNLDVADREKREGEGCHLEDFVVNFHNIDLTYVLAPFEYNARKCVGSCSHTVLRRHGHLATNHAKIMASAVAIKNYDPSTPFRLPPVNPCCVPTKFRSISLLILDERDGLNYGVYPSMMVTSCGCR